MISNFVSDWQDITFCGGVVRDLPAYKHGFGRSVVAMTTARINGTTPGSYTWSPPI
jgi:hypothetical protein